MRLLQAVLGASIACALAFASMPAIAQKAKPATKPGAKPAAPKASKFGALAVDRSKAFVFAWAYDHPSRAAASDFALEECRKRDGNCSVVVEFSGEGCASYHTISPEDGTAYGWGTAPTQAAAQSRSLQECNAFADGRAMCSNHVWACNSKDVASFKVLREDPVKPKPARTDCLVQYEIEIDDSNDDWVNRYRSPLYRLSAKDCPLTASSQYHSFHHNVWDGRVSQSESNPEKKNPALQKKGFDMAEGFFNWIMAKPNPEPGTHYRPAASVAASAPTDENIADMTQDTGRSDSDRVHGICLDYAPPGVMPVSVHGVENCRSWVR